MRQGDWKLVVARGGSQQPELYNLADDISESKNLASEKPEVLAKLQASYDTWNAEQAPPSVPDQPSAKKADPKKKAANKKGAAKKKAS